MRFDRHLMGKLLLAASLLLLQTAACTGCSAGNHAQQPVALPFQSGEFDNQTKNYIGTLPKLTQALSDIDSNKLQGDTTRLNGLAQDKKDALDDLQTVYKDSQDVLSQHKFHDELQLMFDTGLLEENLSILSSDIAQLADQARANRVQGLRWFAGLEGSGASTTIFHMQCYTYLLTRAKAVDSKP